MAKDDYPFYVARDPVARGAFRRESAGPGECSWCGQKKKVLFYYTWEPNDRPRNTPTYNKIRFCNKECRDVYCQ